jgi:AcrR family transcriptional regulator
LVSEEATDFDEMTDMLWSPPRLRTRGPKPASSPKSVVEAGIIIADAEGLTAVTMQRVAQQLGFTKMALYRYVPSRTALVAAMADRALGPPPLFEVESDWRQGLWAWALAGYNAYLAHPWTLEATLGPRVIGPNEAGWTETGLVLLADTPLRGAERFDVLAVTIGHARAMAEQHLGNRNSVAPAASTELQFIAGVKRNPDKYPEFAKAAADVELNGGADNALEFGLNCIFDGVALRLRPKFL